MLTGQDGRRRFAIAAAIVGAGVLALQPRAMAQG